jgi:hypothetical protein
LVKHHVSEVNSASITRLKCIKIANLLCQEYSTKPVWGQECNELYRCFTSYTYILTSAQEGEPHIEVLFALKNIMKKV